MRKHVLSVTLITAAFVAVGILMDLFAQGKARTPDPGRIQPTLGSTLPASLDAYYPPQAPQPVYRFQMIALGNAFTGVISDLLEGDIANAETGFGAFKTLYTEISKLVPEWQKLFPSAPLAGAESALKAAIQAKDPGPFMGAMQKLESACGSCHYEYMGVVHQKYHWKDFAAVTAKDPLSGRTLSYPQLMQALNLGFSGSWIDFGQEQPENARKRFQEFKGHFQALKDTCADCHGTSERKYFVDAEAQAMVDAYGKNLEQKPADLKRSQDAMMAVGNEICFKCHLVHVSAAYSKRT